MGGLTDAVGTVAVRLAFADDDNGHRVAGPRVQGQRAPAAKDLVVGVRGNGQDAPSALNHVHRARPFLAKPVHLIPAP